jgi:uncharacterized protein YecE (DUF72 family)
MPEDFGSFLALLPKQKNGVPLRHAVEVGNPAFACPAFYGLARRHGTAIVYAKDEDFPEIDEQTADFTDARLMTSREDMSTSTTKSEVNGFARQAAEWEKW